MVDSVKISDFNARLKEISNEATNFREFFYEEMLGYNVLRSLPFRFFMDVKAIKQSQKVEELKLDALMRNLETCELDMDEEAKLEKKKSYHNAE